MKLRMNFTKPRRLFSRRTTSCSPTLSLVNVEAEPDKFFANKWLFLV